MPTDLFPKEPSTGEMYIPSYLKNLELEYWISPQEISTNIITKNF
jgi:hypothetical protein